MIHSFVITLNSSTGKQRLKKFQKSVQEHIPFIPIEIYTAETHSKGGTYGCWKSHKHVLLKALQKNLEYVLIFEDDACITSEFNVNAFYSILDQIQTLPKDWDLIGLGGIASCWSSAPQQYSSTFYNTPFYELHSYIASKKFMQSIVYMNYEGQVDYAFSRRAFSTSYLTSIELFTQDDLLGSHNKLQVLIIPFRTFFKKINHLCMKFQLKIRNVVLLLIFMLSLFTLKLKFLKTVLFLILFLFDSVLDSTFVFRKSLINVCSID
jgi:GR25 family glycosyltransferase involved in LPS biosynthesis